MQFWLVVSALAGVLGLVLLSNATMGVGVIGFACLCAIWARMVQAGDHHGQRQQTAAPVTAAKSDAA